MLEPEITNTPAIQLEPQTHVAPKPKRYWLRGGIIGVVVLILMLMGPIFAVSTKIPFLFIAGFVLYGVPLSFLEFLENSLGVQGLVDAGGGDLFSFTEPTMPGLVVLLVCAFSLGSLLGIITGIELRKNRFGGFKKRISIVFLVLFLLVLPYIVPANSISCSLQIGSSNFRDECYESLAKRKEDWAFCSRVTSEGGNRTHCIASVSAEGAVASSLNDRYTDDNIDFLYNKKLLTVMPGPLNGPEVDLSLIANSVGITYLKISTVSQANPSTDIDITTYTPSKDVYRTDQKKIGNHTYTIERSFNETIYYRARIDQRIDLAISYNFGTFDNGPTALDGVEAIIYSLKLH